VLKALEQLAADRKINMTTADISEKILMVNIYVSDSADKQISKHSDINAILTNKIQQNLG
jgi:hypothetical protein